MIASVAALFYVTKSGEMIGATTSAAGVSITVMPAVESTTGASRVTAGSTTLETAGATRSAV